jgi:2,4-dienoyl-CoA reductase [(3E)-enoyl-CoA-producing], mitochondrial
MIIPQAIKTLMLPMNTYKTKRVLITGGATGIGLTMAQSYAKLGADVLICSRNVEQLIRSAKTHPNITYRQLDVRDLPAVAVMAEELSKSNELPHIIINNAAGNFISPTENLSQNAWNSIIDIVLKGTFAVTHELGKQLISRKQSAVFLNISTTYAETGSSYIVPSSVAKAGCNNLTKSLASEWAKYGMRFHSIAVGPIYTVGAFSRLDPDGTLQEKGMKSLCVKRMGQKEEVANLATYLTSDYANWMTGCIINLDGGETVWKSGEFNQVTIPSKL